MVVGAGVMGAGVAYVAATAGAAVTLVDVADAQLERALASLERDLRAGVARGKLEDADVAPTLSRVRTTTELGDACDGADLVVEAVLERMDVKHDVLREVGAAAPPDALIATNTSSMSITEVISALPDPGRGIGMHFFNPVPKMRLIELVRGLQTSERTLHRASEFARVMGKRTVVVEDLPGFVTSRINILIGNESMRILEEHGATPDDIDTAVKLGLNHPMGPLELGDLVGWDTRLHILEYLAATLGDRYRPTSLHRRLVAAGRHGRKSGRGVYAYAADGTRRDEPSDLGRRP